MKSFKPSFAAASCFALALAACGEESAEVDPVDIEATEPVATAEFDPMTRDYDLSEEAQMRRDEFDVDAFQEEYRGYRDEIAGSTEDGSMAGGDMEAGSGEMSGGDTPDSNMESGSTGTGMLERSSMSWSYLDRNSDGQLSVAEYAIWAIPLDPTEPLPNDETAPYVTAEQANTAADSFFYYDTDGDSYISQREFTTARRGEDVTTTA